MTEDQQKDRVANGDNDDKQIHITPADRDAFPAPTTPPADASAEASVAGRDHDPSTGRFLAGGQAWRRGQEARIAKGAAIRSGRLRRTKRLLATLTLDDVEMSAHRLRGLVLDHDPKVALAAIKLVLDSCTLPDRGETAPDAGEGGRPTFTFVIPSGGLDATSSRRVENEASGGGGAGAPFAGRRGT